VPVIACDRIDAANMAVRDKPSVLRGLSNIHTSEIASR